MHKRMAGLLGAAAALTTLGAAQAVAAPAPSIPQANSYADLLEPVANPVEVLRADDAQRADASQATVQLAQYHHHHNHHHRYRRHHHHHHHHHHAGFAIQVR